VGHAGMTSIDSESQDFDFPSTTIDSISSYTQSIPNHSLMCPQSLSVLSRASLYNLSSTTLRVTQTVARPKWVGKAKKELCTIECYFSWPFQYMAAGHFRF
jgi:hypothetical protein